MNMITLANIDAVRGTGRNRHHRRQCYRHPHHHSTLRELVEFLGSLRGVKTPPSTWDDLERKDAKDRSWKRHRKFQWKPEA